MLGICVKFADSGLSVAAQTFAIICAMGLTKFVAKKLGNRNGWVNVDWIFQVPLLIQGVLCPLIGKLSTIFRQKYLALVLAAICSVGATFSSRATSLDSIVCGQLLAGLGWVGLPLVWILYTFRC